MSSAADSESEDEPGVFDAAREAWQEQKGKRRRGQAVSKEETTAVLNSYFADVDGHESALRPWRLRHAVAVSGLALATVRKIVSRQRRSFTMASTARTSTTLGCKPSSMPMMT